MVLQRGYAFFLIEFYKIMRLSRIVVHQKHVKDNDGKVDSKSNHNHAQNLNKNEEQENCT